MQDELRAYRRRGGLTRRKLKEYIPVMIITNLSLLLITSVDGIVVGNFVGKEALSSVNIFFPVLVLTGAFSALTASGIATSISTAMGRNDTDELERIKAYSFRIMIMMAIIVGAVQLPIVWGMISSYGLSQDMFDMTWQYAIGCMISTPLGLISTVGTYQMQISGKMKILMILTLIEGVCNLVFDLLFVGALKMGVAGAGFGTAAANMVRCILTIIYLSQSSNIYSTGKLKMKGRDVREILSCGVPDAAFPVINAIQNYFIMRIMLGVFGVDGGVICGVCSFALSIANVFIFGIQGGARPLMGLYTGADDRIAQKELIRNGSLVACGLLGAVTVFVLLVPQLLYELHGVKSIPGGGLLALQLFSLFFVIRGVVFLYRLYFSNRRDIKFATALTVAGNASLIAFAFALSASVSPPYIMLAYLLTEVLLFVISYARYRWWVRKDKGKNADDIVKYMTVTPEKAIDASRDIRSFADRNGIEKRVSYRTALCMEEMVAYAQLTKESPHRNSDDKGVEVLVRFKGKDGAVFVTLDEGKCIALDKDEENKKLITDNYGLIKKIAKSVEYQYILNMNYTRITF